MAFNPNNYKAPEVKKLPVILLLDVSSSMRGAKIDSLHTNRLSCLLSKIREKFCHMYIMVNWNMQM